MAAPLIPASCRKKRVFCTNCRFLSSNLYIAFPDTIYTCTHPKNKDSSKDTWLREYIGRKHPRDINKNNDCVWYKRYKLRARY